MSKLSFAANAKKKRASTASASAIPASAAPSTIMLAPIRQTSHGSSNSPSTANETLLSVPANTPGNKNENKKFDANKDNNEGRDANNSNSLNSFAAAVSLMAAASDANGNKNSDDTNECHSTTVFINGNNNNKHDLEHGSAVHVYEDGDDMDSSIEMERKGSTFSDSTKRFLYSGTALAKGATAAGVANSSTLGNDASDDDHESEEEEDSIIVQERDEQYQQPLSESHQDYEGDSDGTNLVTNGGGGGKLALAIEQKKKKLICCCIMTLMLLAGAIGAVVYMAAYRDRDVVPTEAPTVSPAPTASFQPSISPSSSPTMRPTLSNQPSSAPSSAPSGSPSASPSAGPTSSPQPSAAPSASPSSSPTTSMQPSSAPSASPTRDFRSILEAFLLNGYDIDIAAAAPNAPSAMALDWILDETHGSGTQSIALSNELLQRFALVTLELGLQEDAAANVRQNNNAIAPKIATKSVNECDWDGISCNDDGEVTKVDWSRKDLKGSIPSEIRLLFRLRHLDLSNQDIRGAIPKELYSLVNLEKLYLYKNNLSGSLSTRIGQLDKITHFHVSHNKLKGSIPQQLQSDKGSDGGIRPLRYFNVYSNQLTGSVPEDLRLRDLEYFDVGRNQLKGKLPNDLAVSCVKLRHLHLDHNAFTGTLPLAYNSVGNDRLESLTINHNQLTGVVNGQRALYNKLVVYTLQENQFSSLDAENCQPIIPRGEMPEFKADCDICQCDDYFDLCGRYCDDVKKRQ